MLIKIGDFECTEVWDGVFYKKLSNYPQISDWELKTIIEFIEYEKSYDRECKIECEDSNVLNLINESIPHKEVYLSTPRPKLLTECTACPYRKGCITDYVGSICDIHALAEVFSDYLGDRRFGYVDFGVEREQCGASGCVGCDEDKTCL